MVQFRRTPDMCPTTMRIETSDNWICGFGGGGDSPAEQRAAEPGSLFGFVSVQRSVPRSFGARIQLHGNHVIHIFLVWLVLVDPHAARTRLAFSDGVTRLDAPGAVAELAEQSLIHGGVPRKAAEGATHIAVAVINGVDFLVTWNLKHLANVDQRSRIERVCQAMGYTPVVIYTPNDLTAGHYGTLEG